MGAILFGVLRLRDTSPSGVLPQSKQEVQPVYVETPATWVVSHEAVNCCRVVAFLVVLSVGDVRCTRQGVASGSLI